MLTAPDLLSAAPEDTLRPVTFSDIGKCCGPRCMCYGKGYVTYLVGKTKAARKQEHKVCERGLVKFMNKKGHLTMEHKGIRVWLPPGAQTIQRGNPLRGAMRLRRQAKAGRLPEHHASPPREPDQPSS